MTNATGVSSTICQSYSKWKKAIISALMVLTICFGVNISGGLDTSGIVKYRPMPPIQKFSTTLFLNTERKIAECSHLFQNLSFSGKGKNMRLFNIHGCELKNYVSRKTFQSCFNPGDHIAFIGDSRVRQFYCYVKSSWINAKVNGLRFFHDDDVQTFDGVTTEFRWHSYVDDGMSDILNGWLNGTKPRPTHIFVGAGVWRIQKNYADVKEEANYEKNLNKILKYLLELKRKSYVAWLPQDPVDERIKDLMRSKTVNTIIDKYNAIAKKVLKQGSF